MSKHKQKVGRYGEGIEPYDPVKSGHTAYAWDDSKCLGVASARIEELESKYLAMKTRWGDAFEGMKRALRRAEKAEAEVERLKKRTKDAEHRSRVAEKYNTQFCQERDRLRTAIERHKHEYLSAHYPTHIDADRALWATLDPSPDKRVDDGGDAVNECGDQTCNHGYVPVRPGKMEPCQQCNPTPQGCAEAVSPHSAQYWAKLYHAMTQRHAALREKMEILDEYYSNSPGFYQSVANDALRADDERMAKGEGME